MLPTFFENAYWNKPLSRVDISMNERKKLRNLHVLGDVLLLFHVETQTRRLSVYVYRSKLTFFTEEEARETCGLQCFNKGVEHFKTMKIRFNFIERKISLSHETISLQVPYQNIKTCIFLSIVPLRTPFPSNLLVPGAFSVPIFWRRFY